MMDWTQIEPPTGFIGAGKLMQQLARERHQRNTPPVTEFLRRQVVIKKKRSRKS